MLIEMSVMGVRCARHAASRYAVFFAESAAQAISQIETT